MIMDVTMNREKLKKLLTPEFLSTLHTAVECCGWSTDMMVTMTFCDWCYEIAKVEMPEFDVDFEMDDT